jgi:hypothetical protein
VRIVRCIVILVRVNRAIVHRLRRNLGGAPDFEPVYSRKIRNRRQADDSGRLLQFLQELCMRLSPRLGFRLILVAIAVAIIGLRLIPRHLPRTPSRPSTPDLSATNPLNQPGGGTVPPEAYEVYSALYQVPSDEPLVFSEKSVTDIPQVGGSCLKPTTPDEHEMADAFVAANAQSHRWEPKFAIPQGYRLLSAADAVEAQGCLQTHGADAAKCGSYRTVRHVRFLGVPGFDHAHTHALVSVIKMCGNFCGSGGIFAVEKTGASWQRAGAADFTRDCSWAY